MKEQLLDKTIEYVIGVSGGCDSMYLLDTLYNKGYKLHVCHINYNYREDSHLDTELVKDYCKKREIDLHIKECDESEYEVGNFQASARDLRYAFYKEIADKYQIETVLLAHHKDDYLENVVMQLEKHLVYFYLGIQEVSYNYGLKIIRPLLDTYKEEIRTVCDKNLIPYRDDYTNFETFFKRDEIRNTVLNTYSYTQKEELYFKAVKHNQRIEGLKNKLKPQLDQYYKEGSIDINEINKELLSLFIYLILFEQVKVDVTSRLVDEVIKQISSDKPNIKMDLPVNNVFIKEYNNIRIEKVCVVQDYEYRVNKGEFFDTSYFKVCDHGHINQGIDVKDNEYPLIIRNARSGDVIVTKGGTKKVSRVFINAKIPSSKRQYYPVVVNAQGEIILISNLAKNFKHLSTNANIFVII